MPRLIIIILLFFAALSLSHASKVMVIEVETGIGPAVAAYIETAIEEAEESNAAALVIRLNTPGGLLDATREIVTSIMASKVPVAVYVAPGGSRAGSAGVFITMAAHIAAMAPGTNIGAAHPVGVDGSSDSASVMTDKVTNDAAAFIRSITNERGRNAEWAELTVRESIASTEREAYEAGAIDFISSSLDSLLIQMHGKVVNLDGNETAINTADVEIERREMNWRESLLAMISNPNIAYLLMIIGFYGIMMEVYAPGSIFPGVIGGISILLAAYSLQMLPINTVGLGLIILAFILFMIEIFVQSYGILSLGGAVSLLLGSIMLIDSPLEFMEISMSLILTVSITTAIIFLLIIGIGVRSQFIKKSSGNDALIGKIGIARSDIRPGVPGNVHVYGEIWKATSHEEIKTGDKVVVVNMDNFNLEVKKSLES